MLRLETDRFDELIASGERVRGFVKVNASLALVSLAVGCAGIGDSAPKTTVVLDNRYAPTATDQRVVYRAFWQAVSFQRPVAPGASSDPQDTVPASENTAYAVLAPGFALTSTTPPASMIVLRSKQGFKVRLDETLHIPIDDTTFVGNCAAGSFLTQEEADFITQRVFARDFMMLSYDAATCTSAATGDAQGPR